MSLPSPEYVPISQLPSCCGGAAPCPYHEEVITLRQQVVTDSLTGLYNSGYFRKALAQELERTERTSLPIALMMVDLDFFKKINDSYGHEVGNDVLTYVSKLIVKGTRALDIQCRYGGEEFAVILPATERFLAIQVAERLAKSIENSTVYSHGHELKITASIGLAFHKVGELASVTTLVAEADKYLYQAKNNGRNQVCFEAESEIETTVSSEEKDELRNIFGWND